jgi:hypothetical protein
MGFLKKAWQGWKAFANRLGKIQTLILMTLFYFLILGPVAICLRLLGKRPLRYSLSGQTYWQDRPANTRGEAQYFQQY